MELEKIKFLKERIPGGRCAALLLVCRDGTFVNPREPG
jgi:hypothetical protein